VDRGIVRIKAKIWERKWGRDHRKGEIVIKSLRMCEERKYDISVSGIN